MKALLSRTGKIVGFLFAIIALLALCQVALKFNDWVATMGWFQIAKTVLLCACLGSAVLGTVFFAIPMWIKERKDAAEGAANWANRRHEETQMQETFLVNDHDQVQGSFSLREICQGLNDGTFSRMATVFKDGDWKQPHEVGVVYDQPDAAPAPSWAG